jgi:hypothetical protein
MHQELLDGAGQRGRNGFAIGDHGHVPRVMRSPWK